MEGFEKSVSWWQRSGGGSIGADPFITEDLLVPRDDIDNQQLRGARGTFVWAECLREEAVGIAGSRAQVTRKHATRRESLALRLREHNQAADALANTAMATVHICQFAPDTERMITHQWRGN
ncbi:hypothetical protein PI125_g7050 [Phytophthora idaei]|nr:hypothetical protein PI125_g7050 [Phytophthora idaei]